MTPKFLYALQLAVLSLILGSFPAHAEDDLKTLAHDICHAYLDHPEEFKPIEMQNCLVVTDSSRIQSEKCFTHFDQKFQKQEALVQVDRGGTCHSYDIGKIGTDSKVTYLELSNEVENSYGFGATELPLDYKGHLVILSNETNDLKLVQGDKKIIICNIYDRQLDWKPNEDTNNPVCKKFENHDYKSKKTPILKEDVNSHPKYPHDVFAYFTHPVARYNADLNHDGKEEMLFQYEYGSGAGCGSGGFPLLLLYKNKFITDDDWYKVSKGESQESINAKILGQSLFELTEPKHGRGVYTEIVTINSKDYIADKNDKHRYLYDFTGNYFKKICSQEKNIIKEVGIEESLQ